MLSAAELSWDESSMIASGGHIDSRYEPKHQSKIKIFVPDIVIGSRAVQIASWP
jgi:hypothetical protein